MPNVRLPTAVTTPLRRLASCTLAGLALAWALPAQATVYRLDSLELTRNGTLLLTDNFDDGLPPPAGLNFIASTIPAYTSNRVVGDFTGAEANGKLSLDAVNKGLATLNRFTGLPEGVLFQAAYLNVNTDDLPENSARGLKLQHTFSYSAVFDLITPELADRFDSYGLRLADFDNTGASGWNDVLDLQIFKSTVSGAPVLLLVERNFQANTRNTLQTVTLDPSLGDQIRLSFVKSTAGDATVRGSYQYLNGGVAGAPQTLSASAQLFEGETFTRPGFFAVANVTQAVPEPASSALCGLALAGLALTRRRRA